MAQTVEWANQQKLKSRTNYTMVLGENPSGYFLLRSKDNEFTRELLMERYKSNLGLDYSKELWQPSGSVIERVLLQPTGLLIFGIVRNNPIDKYDFLYWKTDDNLNGELTAKTLFQVDAGLVRNKNAFYIKQSLDRSKLYVMYVMRSAKENESVLVVNAYNSDFTVIYTRQYKLSSEIEDVFITSFECDNDGNTFALIDFPKSNTNRKKSLQRDFYLYGIYTNQVDLTEYALNADSMDIIDLGMVMNHYNKSITVTGFYKSKKDQNNLDGMFTTSIDIATEAIKAHKYFSFDKAMVSKVTSVISNENSPGFNDLIIRKIIPRSDGGYLVLAEKFYETKQTYTYYVNGFPQSSSRTVYNFDEIIVFSVNADAKIQFTEVIKKRQSSVNDGGYYSSFVAANTNNSVALVYSLDASPESDVLISTITPKGEIDTRILIKSMSYYVSLMPPESKQVSSNVSIICALKDRKFSIMKVTY